MNGLDINELNGTANVIKNSIRKKLLHCNDFQSSKPQKRSSSLLYNIANMKYLDIKEWNGTANIIIKHITKKLLHCNDFQRSKP